jgi:hypothetical protein
VGYELIQGGLLVLVLVLVLVLILLSQRTKRQGRLLVMLVALVMPVLVVLVLVEHIKRATEGAAFDVSSAVNTAFSFPSFSYVALLPLAPCDLH